MRRALLWYLGLTDTRTGREDQWVQTETVRLEDTAQRQLLNGLDTRGRWHGGALFGTTQDGTLTVLLTIPSAPPGTAGHPLSISLPYLVGASQGIDRALGGEIDWAGQWIAAPDGRLPDRRVDLLWAAQGASRGLVDDRHPLLVVGVLEGYLVGRAYVFDEGSVVEVSCPLGPLTG